MNEARNSGPLDDREPPDSGAGVRAILDAIEDGAALLDSGGRLVHLNGRGAAMLGVLPGELIGRPILETLEAGSRAPGAPQGGTPLARAHVAGRALQDEAALFERHDGHQISVGYSLAPLPAGGALLLFRDNSGLRSRIAELELGSRRQRELLDGIRDVALALVDPDGHIVSWEAGAARLTGYPAGRAVGRGVGFPVAPETPEEERPESALNRAARDGRTEDRAWWVRPDGERIWMETVTTALRAPDGRLTGFARVSYDGTRRRLDAERQETLLRMTHLLATSHTLVAAAPRLLEALAEGFGGEMAEIWVLDPASQSLCLAASWGSSGRGSIESGEELRLGAWRGLPGRVWAGGEPIWIRDIRADVNYMGNSAAAQAGMTSALGFPILREGEACGVISVFGRAIPPTDESLLHVMGAVGTLMGQFLDRQKAAERLQEAHAETEQLVSAISSILISVDARGRVARWNDPAAAVLGITAGDALGRPLADLQVGWPAATLADAMSACRNGAGPVRLDDFRFRRMDGRDVCLALTVSPVAGAGNAAGGALILGSDITERRQLEAQLAQAQKLESMGQLAAGIAHELNTPIEYLGENLRFLYGAFRDLRRLQVKYDFLMMEARRGRVPQELVDDIDEAATTADTENLAREIPRALQQSTDGIERMAGIIKAMKEFSHPGARERTPIDLNRAIENTVTVSRSAWRDEADVITDLDRSLPAVPVLAGEFNQVILNILVNAAQAIQETRRNAGSAAGHGAGNDSRGIIVVQTRRAGDQVEIRIRDTGAGIPEEIQSRVFDPFFTTKPAGSGTGQGLAIAHAVITRKHGGSLVFESTPGRGTTFVIRLPLFPDTAADHPSGSIAADPARGASTASAESSPGIDVEVTAELADAVPVLGLTRLDAPGRPGDTEGAPDGSSLASPDAGTSMGDFPGDDRREAV